jgi:hypothetical protein
VIVAGVILYATSSDLRRPARIGLISIGLFMLAMQAIFNFGLGPR